MVHRTAAEGFVRSAEAYERGRPRYPDAAVTLVVSRLPEGATVLDLAARTGMLTRTLLAAGLRVVAVEPVAEMRAALPASARALDGTAEAIPLGDAAVDAVVVGQAFHWFDGDAALAEIHRVLRRDGLLALLWNRLVAEDPINRAIDELLAPYRADVPTHRTNAWRAAFCHTSLFAPLEEHELANEQRLDAAGMEARGGSISFIASLDEPESERVLERARARRRSIACATPFIAARRPPRRPLGDRRHRPPVAPAPRRRRPQQPLSHPGRPSLDRLRGHLLRIDRMGPGPPDLAVPRPRQGRPARRLRASPRGGACAVRRGPQAAVGSPVGGLHGGAPPAPPPRRPSPIEPVGGQVRRCRPWSSDSASSRWASATSPGRGASMRRSAGTRGPSRATT